MQRRTKIVATLGPASASSSQIENLIAAGANVLRLNFSHGSREEHAQRCTDIRRIESKLRSPVCVLADLQGPKFRIGCFKEGSIRLQPNDTFALDGDPATGGRERVTLPHPELIYAARADQTLLLDDGKLRLRVLEAQAGILMTRVEVGGILSDRKGIAAPGLSVAIPALTEKDRVDLETALESGADWVALSFVQKAEDVFELKRLVGGRAGILVKIEKPAAVQDLDRIIAAADAVMVARGDLGVEMPAESVPNIQRSIVRRARARGIPVIVATQMLDSMVRMPAPTRAEASDVATAVLEGADAVMLSAESASGGYPVEAVRMMDRIIREVENSEDYVAHLAMNAPTRETSPEDIVCHAFKTAVEFTGAPFGIAFTSSGHTAMRAARQRPSCFLLCLTPSIATARRLALVWGVDSREAKDVQHFDEMLEVAACSVRESTWASSISHIPVIAGVPFGRPGTTNLFHLLSTAGLIPLACASRAKM